MGAPLARALLASLLLFGSLLAPTVSQPAFLLPGALLRQAPPVLPDEAFALDTVPEDINADGIVNAADLRAFTVDWKAAKAGGAVKARSDFDGNGKIDTADAGRILKWRLFCEQYGSYTKPEARKRIGPAGGAIAVSGLTLNVPAGAFATEAALIVYRVPGLPGLNEDCATGTYRLEGLPRSIAKPLKVALTLTAGQTTSDSTFLVLSARGGSKSGGPGNPVLPLEATVSGGKVVGYIPPTGDSVADVPAQDEEPQTFVYSVLTGQRALYSPNKRFQVIFDRRSCTATRAAIIADYAERAYNAIETDCGLSWARRTRYPIDITVRDLGSMDSNMAEASASVLGVNYLQICANSQWCQSDEDTRELAIAVEHEVMHLAQYLYDPRGAWAVASGAPRWLWFDEASAVFFEYHRGVDRVPKPLVLPVPNVARGNVAFLMKHGLEYPVPDGSDAAKKLVQGHGYGASMFLNYLEAYTNPAFGLAAVGNVYKAYYANKSLRPCEALANGLGGNQVLGARFTDFVDKWMLGTVYGATRPQRFPESKLIVGEVAATGRRHLFLNGESVSPLFTGEADDLSIWPAVLYKPSGLPDGSTLLSVLGGDYVYYTNRCYAYKDKTQPLQYIGAAGQTGKLVLQNFEDVGNSVIMVCVHNAARYPFTDRQPCAVRGMVKPIITKITPPSGPNGTPIVIEGWGFGPAQVTSLDLLIAGPASAQSWSNTRIEATVWITSGPGSLTIYVNNFALGMAYPVPECTGTYPWTLTGP